MAIIRSHCEKHCSRFRDIRLLSEHQRWLLGFRRPFASHIATCDIAEIQFSSQHVGNDFIVNAQSNAPDRFKRFVTVIVFYVHSFATHAFQLSVLYCTADTDL